jgi:hypothetical protein
MKILGRMLLLVAVLCGRLAGQDIRPQLSGFVADEWTIDGNGAWDFAEGKLVLTKAGNPDVLPIRRPAALAVLQSRPFGRASVRVQVRSTAPVDVMQRDLQVVLAYQGPRRFYYVHLAGLTDAVHNGIFVVADGDRRRLDSGRGIPQLTDQAWHDVRVDWDGSTGRIAVFVDGSAAPVLEATDTTLSQGRIGFGSFDDTGEFRAIQVLGSS